MVEHKTAKKKVGSKWGLYSRMLACPNNRMCPLCAESPDDRPRHNGPYFTLKRSRPKDWPSKQEVYLGILANLEKRTLEGRLFELDTRFPKGRPTKEVVFDIIRRVE